MFQKIFVSGLGVYVFGVKPGGVQHAAGSGNDFVADAVAFNQCNAVFCHSEGSLGDEWRAGAA